MAAITNTMPILSPKCDLELDFPWLVPSTVLPSVGVPEMLPAWTPVRGATPSIDQVDRTRTSTPNTSSYVDLPQTPPSGMGISSPETSAYNSSGYCSGSPSLSESDASPSTSKSLADAKKEKPKKPSSSYIEMIARALLSAPGRRLILQDLYAYILQHYPYYQTAETTWKNAVRHNLCVNECFMKDGRSKSSRGFFWTIHPACLEMFSKGDFTRMKAKRLAQKMYKSLRAASESIPKAAPAAPAAPVAVSPVYNSAPNASYYCRTPDAYTASSSTRSPTYPAGHPYMTSSSTSSSMGTQANFFAYGHQGFAGVQSPVYNYPNYASFNGPSMYQQNLPGSYQTPSYNQYYHQMAAPVTSSPVYQQTSMGAPYYR